MGRTRLAHAIGLRLILGVLLAIPANAQTGVTEHQKVAITSTAADALDAAGGIQAGSGNVGIVDTAGQIPAISSIYFADLAATNLTGTATLTSVVLGSTTFASRSITSATGGVLNIVLDGAAGDDFTVDTTKLVVEGDTGNVGLGIAAPTSTLHMSSASGDITIARDSGASVLIQAGAITGRSQLRNTTDNGWGLWANNLEYLTILKTGFVGVSETTPTTELEVAGVTTLDGLRIETLDKTGAYTLIATDFNITGDTTGGAFSLTLISSPTDGQTYTIRRVNSGSNDLTIAGNGTNINGAASIALVTQYESVILIYNGDDGEWGIY